MTILDYEKKIWGSQSASLSIFNSYCRPLRNVLESIAKARGKILDLGCGAGAFTAALKDYRPDFNLIGLDLSKKAIRLAKQKHKEIGFIQAKVDKIPFKKNSFEVVTGNHLIEHLDDPKRALAEIYRVLKPKGIFWSSVPLEGDWLSLVKWLGFLKKFKENRNKYLDHKQLFDKKKYLRLLEEAGFKIKKINWSGHSTYQLIDAVYYPLLEVLGKKPEYLAEVEMFGSDKKRWQLVYLFGKRLANLVNNLESLVLAKLPGLIIHVKTVK